MLFTTRYQLTELHVAEVNLGEFPFADTWKKMNRLAKLGSLTTDNKRDIHYEIGGQPRSLELLDSILAETETSWEAIKGKLAQVKQEAYDDLLLDILWGNLTSEAQNLLQLLSLFRAPMAEVELRKFSEFQLNPPDLASLQRMSLLFSVTVPDGGTWYYVHRLTAAFVLAEERLHSEEFRKRHNRVGDYWKEYSKTSRSLDDLLEARYHYLQAKNDKEANNIAFIAEDLLSRWGFLDAALNLNVDTFNLATDKKDKSIALRNIANIHKDQGRYKEAFGFYQRSLNIDQKLGNDYGINRNLLGMAMIFHAWGDYDKALRLYKEALSNVEKLKDDDQISKLNHQMGILYKDRGDYDQALRLYNKSLRIADEIGNLGQVSSSYHQIAMVYQIQGNYHQALILYGKSLDIAEKLNDVSGISSCYHQMGMIYQEIGNDDLALDLYGKSISIAEKIGDISHVSYCYHQMGMVYHARGYYDQALELYSKSLVIKEKLDDIKGIASSQAQIGKLLMDQVKYEEAVPKLLSAYQIYEKLASPDVQLVGDWLRQIIHKIGEQKSKEIVGRLNKPPASESTA